MLTSVKNSKVLITSRQGGLDFRSTILLIGLDDNRFVARTYPNEFGQRFSMAFSISHGVYRKFETHSPRAVLSLKSLVEESRELNTMMSERVVGAVVVGAAVCGRIPGLAKSQREQCRKAPHAMPAVGEGAELGLRECRHQFRHHRWNCSHVANDQIFGHVVVVDI
ncbi:protein Wnt-7a-like isoform X1 [Vespula maculifrons]|uniref:Protein Wnt n=1 Tax=Vespula maculifrons TaxID=7453 RepID=A0ABD2CLQ0_VESMC